MWDKIKLKIAKIIMFAIIYGVSLIGLYLTSVLMGEKTMFTYDDLFVIFTTNALSTGAALYTKEISEE